MVDSQSETIPNSDPDLITVLQEINRISDIEHSAGVVLRDAIDQVLLGDRTGRYSIAQLSRQEKAHIGTQVEIWLRRDLLGNSEGDLLDAKIAGIEVDIKNTIGSNWMIPHEAVDQLCLLSAIDEANRRYSLGLIRTVGNILGKPNQDGKRSLTQEGRSNIQWIVRDGNLPVSVFLMIDGDLRNRVLGQKSGQRRVLELFRNVLKTPILWSDLAIAARQRDVRARARDARRTLAKEGLTVLCGSWLKDRTVAASLGVLLHSDYWISIPSSEIPSS